MDISHAERDPPLGYLARLNEAQRSAVLHGEGGVAGPLLVIAGAGTGKTNTLAHRVAHLILKGADPRRILLMTFSRRAAAEMTRRIERIAGEVLGEKAAAMTAGLTWAGTFHAIGARVLREHAPALGLDPAFTLHDRSNSEDLMNLARHRLGLSRTKSRFPTKGTCLAIYSRAVNARRPLEPLLEADFPWCLGWAAELKSLFAAYVEAKQAAQVLDYDDLLLYWAEMLADPAAAAALGAAFDHVLVDEYQDTNRLQAEILRALKPDGRGVTVVGDDAQAIYGFRAAEVRNILDFPAQFEPRARIVTLERNYRSTEPILAAANAVIGEARERFAKELWTERRSEMRPLLVTVADETAQADYVCAEVLAAREAGTALKAQAVLFRAAHHSGPLEIELTRRNIPFVKFGGLKFLEAAHVKDLLAILRFAENPRDRLAGFRVLQLLPGIGPAAAEDILGGLAADGGSALAAARVPKRADRRLGGVRRAFRTAPDRRRRLARRDRGRPPLVRAAPGAAARGRGAAPGRPGSALPDCPGVLLAIELPDRAHPRPAAGDGRSRRGAAARRGLSRPLHHPFRQGPGMAFGLRAELRRRLHSLRPRHRHAGGDRGGAAPALRGDDPGQGCAAPDHPASLLHTRAGVTGRQACLCGPKPVPARAHPRSVRTTRLELDVAHVHAVAAGSPEGFERTHARNVDVTVPRQKH